MTHLTPDELLDAAEGTLSAERTTHLDACDACRQDVRALEALLRETSGWQVPEPSPLFWEHFPVRVQAAIQADTPARPRPSAPTFRWPAFVPAGALAALVVFAVATLPRGVPPAPLVSRQVDVDIDGATREPDGDVDWYALADLVGPLDWDAADAAGLTVAPGDTDRALAELDDDERRELGQLIARELARAKS